MDEELIPGSKNLIENNEVARLIKEKADVTLKTAFTKGGYYNVFSNAIHLEEGNGKYIPLINLSEYAGFKVSLYITDGNS